MINVPDNIEAGDLDDSLIRTVVWIYFRLHSHPKSHANLGCWQKQKKLTLSSAVLLTGRVGNLLIHLKVIFRNFVNVNMLKAASYLFKDI